MHLNLKSVRARECVSGGILLLIVAVAAVLRFTRLTAIPNGLNQDEAVDGYDAYSLGLTLHDHHGEFLPILLHTYGDWTSPTLTYLTIPFVRLLGLSILTVRLPVALTGTAAVVLIHIFVRQLRGGRALGLIAALILATTPWSITLSRWAIPPDIVPFFLLSSLVLFYWAKDDDSRRGYWKLVLFALSAAALTYSYPTEKVFGPLFVVALCAIFLRGTMRRMTVTVVLYAVLIAPQYLLTLANPEKYNARFDEVSIFGHYATGQLPGEILKRYFEYLGPGFNFGKGDPDPMQHVPGASASYVFLAPFFYLGIALSVWSLIQAAAHRTPRVPQIITPRDHLLLLIWLLVSPVAPSLTINHDHSLRQEQGLLLAVLYPAIGLGFLVALIARYAPARYRRTDMAVYPIATLGIVMAVLCFRPIYFDSYPHISKVDFQYDLGKAILLADSMQGQYRHVLVDANLNESYMYFLFYTRMDPHIIDQRTLDAGRIGKFDFNLTQPPWKGGRHVTSLSDSDGIWYELYRKNGDLYIVDDPNWCPINPSATP